MTARKKIRWTIATARQNLPTLVTLAAREPQEIYRRNELVARVMNPEHAPPAKRPAAEFLADIQHACAEESYTLVPPPRTTRAHPLAPHPKPGKPRSRKGKR